MNHYKVFQEYLDREAKKLGRPVFFDYEDGAIFVSTRGRFKTLESMSKHMEIEQKEKELEEERIQMDEYYRSEQYKIDKAMGK